MPSRDPRYYPPRPPSGDEHPGMANYPSDGEMPRLPAYLLALAGAAGVLAALFGRGLGGSS